VNVLLEYLDLMIVLLEYIDSIFIKSLIILSKCQHNGYLHYTANYSGIITAALEINNSTTCVFEMSNLPHKIPDILYSLLLINLRTLRDMNFGLWCYIYF